MNGTANTQYLAKYLASCLFAALAGLGAVMAEADPSNALAIAVHGGSGTIERGDLSADKEREIRAALAGAVRAGHEILHSGGTSLDAVTRAVVLLEDSPHFNAGRGAVFNAEGRNELDASIMDGATLQAGAIAAVRSIRNPIVLARKVMTESPHVMLMGAGAEQFAREQGVPFEEDDYFYTEYRWQQLQQAKAGPDPQAHYISESPERWLSTVGAVALDAHGNLAAATSTGGTTNKRWGRVGDSPIIGAGTYADNRSCAVSATGHGEYFIRATVARDVCARLQYTDESLDRAAREVVLGQLGKMGGDGGIIAVDRDGNLALVFNTEGMYRASIDREGTLEVRIYANE